MMTNTHNQFSASERRLLHFAEGNGELKIDAGTLKDLNGKVTEQPEKNDAPKTAEEENRRIGTLVQDTNAVFTKYGKHCKKFPVDLQAKFKDETAKFFTTSIDAFDKDKNQPGKKGLSLDEFNNFKKFVTEKIHDQLAKITNSVDGTEKEIDKAEQEAEKAKRATQLEKKSIDDLIKDSTGAVEAAKLTEVRAEQLNDPEHPENMKAELEKHQQNVEKIQKVQEVISKKGQTIADLHEKGQKEMKLMSDGANAAGAAAAAAAGAAVGSLFFGIGAIPGALIGAAIYGVGKGIVAEAMRAKKEALARKINDGMSKGKETFAAGQKLVDTSANIVEVNGGLLNTAPEAMRTEQKRAHDERSAEVTGAKDEIEAKKTERLASKEKLRTYISTLQVNRAALLNPKDAANNPKDLAAKGKDLDAAIASIKDVLAQKKLNPVKQAELEERVKFLESARTNFSGERIQDFEAKKSAKATELLSDAGKVKESLSLIDASVGELEAQSAALDVNQEQLDKGFEEQQLKLDEIDTQIGDGVLDANLSIAKTSNDLSVQANELAKLNKVEVPSMISSLTDGFEGLGKAVKFVFTDLIAEGLDQASAWLKTTSIGTPFAYALDFTSGLSEGIGEMGEGLGTMIAHPLETAEGLSKLFEGGEDGYKARMAMWKALYAGEEFEKGNAGKGLGKIGLNILMTATGIGAAGTGTRALSIAYKASRAAGSGATRSALRAIGTGARVGVTDLVVNTPKNLAKIPGDILKTGAAVLRTPMSLAKGRAAMVAQDLLKSEKAAASATKVLDDAFAKAPAGLDLLKGKSYEELTKLMKNGEDLNAFGINSAERIRAFQELRGLTKSAESANTALSMAQKTNEFVQIDSALEGLTNAVSKDGKVLKDFMDDFNSKSIPDPKNAYRILDGTPNNGLVAFDKDGKLVRVTGDKVSEFLEEAQAAVRGPSGKPMLRIPNYSDSARAIVIRELFPNITPEQYKGLLELQAIELKTPLTSAAKRDKLVAAGFTPEQATSIINSRLLGDGAVVEGFLKNKAGRLGTEKLGDLDLTGLTKIRMEAGGKYEQVYLLGKTDAGGYSVLVKRDGGWKTITMKDPPEAFKKTAENALSNHQTTVLGDVRLGKADGGKKDVFLRRQPDGTFKVEVSPIGSTGDVLGAEPWSTPRVTGENVNLVVAHGDLPPGRYALMEDASGRKFLRDGGNAIPIDESVLARQADLQPPTGRLLSNDDRTGLSSRIGEKIYITDGHQQLALAEVVKGANGETYLRYTTIDGTPGTMKANMLLNIVDTAEAEAYIAKLNDARNPMSAVESPISTTAPSRLKRAGASTVNAVRGVGGAIRRGTKSAVDRVRGRKKSPKTEINVTAEANFGVDVAKGETPPIGAKGKITYGDREISATYVGPEDGNMRFELDVDGKPIAAILSNKQFARMQPGATVVSEVLPVGSRTINIGSNGPTSLTMPLDGIEAGIRSGKLSPDAALNGVNELLGNEGAMFSKDSELLKKLAELQRDIPKWNLERVEKIPVQIGGELVPLGEIEAGVRAGRLSPGEALTAVDRLDRNEGAMFSKDSELLKKLAELQRDIPTWGPAKTRIIPNGDLARMRNAAGNGNNPTTILELKSYLKRPPGITPEIRNELAESLLGKKLSPKQQDALNRAHNHGTGSIDNYSTGDNITKGKILRNEFTAAETKLLMDSGLAGNPAPAKSLFDRGHAVQVTDANGGIMNGRINSSMKDGKGTVFYNVEFDDGQLRMVKGDSVKTLDASSPTPVAAPVAGPEIIKREKPVSKGPKKLENGTPEYTEAVEKGRVKGSIANATDERLSAVSRQMAADLEQDFAMITQELADVLPPDARFTVTAANYQELFTTRFRPYVSEEAGKIIFKLEKKFQRMAEVDKEIAKRANARPLIIEGATGVPNFEAAIAVRSPDEILRTAAEAIDNQRFILEGRAEKMANATAGDAVVLKGPFESARKKLKAMEAQKEFVNDVMAGKVKFTKGPNGEWIPPKEYQGIRDLKSLGLSIQDQKMIAKKILEDSGVSANELTNVKHTLPAEFLEQSRAVRLSPATATRELPKKPAFAASAEKLEDACKAQEPLQALGKIIEDIPAGPEREVLLKLKDDLVNLKGVPLDDAEKALILRESMEYLSDYQKALDAGVRSGTPAFEGRVVTTQDMFDLLRDNQHKLAHQTIFDRRYMTGSDHGVLHVLEADMRWGDRIATQLVLDGKMTAEEKLLLRQATIDHDLGYAFHPLDHLNKSGNTYFALTKDHPLFSALAFEEASEYFGKYFGAKNHDMLKGIVLDHSDAMNKAGLATAKGQELIAAVLAQADCLGVSADFKMMKLFKDPEMMVGLLQAYDSVEELSTILQQVTKLADTVGVVHPDVAALVQRADTISTQVSQVRTRMLGILDQRAANAAPGSHAAELRKVYGLAIDKFFSSNNPTFAALRDFGSHAIELARPPALENGRIVMRLRANDVFAAILERSPLRLPNAPRLKPTLEEVMATKAIAKAIEDFGYPKLTDEKIMQVADALRGGKPVHFTGGKADILISPVVREGSINAQAQALAKVIRRETSLKNINDILSNPSAKAAEVENAFAKLLDTVDGTYALEGRPATDIAREAEKLWVTGKKDEAKKLLEDLRSKGKPAVRIAA